MLDSKLIELTNRLVSQRLDDLYREQAAQQRRILEEGAKRGFSMPSGQQYADLDQLQETSIKKRQEIVWSSLKQVLDASQPGYSPELAEELKREVEKFFPSSLTEPQNYLQGAGWRKPPFTDDDIQRSKLEAIQTSSLARIHNEIDLFVTNIKPKDIMAPLFLSYRRADSQEVVGRMYDRLRVHIPVERIFRDLDSIPLGKPFPEVIREAVGKSAVALVIVGPAWVTIADERGRRRLDDPSDFVRIEVELALSSGILVIPVLVSGATMPAAEQLPVSLQALVSLQAARVGPDPDFHRDMDRLIGKLSFFVEKPNTTAHGK